MLRARRSSIVPPPTVLYASRDAVPAMRRAFPCVRNCIRSRFSVLKDALFSLVRALVSERARHRHAVDATQLETLFITRLLNTAKRPTPVLGADRVAQVLMTVAQHIEMGRWV